MDQSWEVDPRRFGKEKGTVCACLSEDKACFSCCSNGRICYCIFSRSILLLAEPEGAFFLAGVPASMPAWLPAWPKALVPAWVLTGVLA